MTTTLRFGRVERTMLLACGERNPSDDDWSVWVEAYAQGTVEHQVRSLLVASRGGGPNARQRKRLMAALMDTLANGVDEFRTAVCGDGPAVRAITAAIGWASGAPHMKGFAYDDREKALQYLRAPENQWHEITLTMRRLESELAHGRGRGS